MEMPEPEAGWLRHPVFYNPTDNAVFLVVMSDVLIRVSSAQWAHRSPFIKTLMHGHLGKPGEGESDKCPIPLLVGTMPEYEDFLTIIFPRCARDIGAMSEREPRELLAIFKLTSYFDMHEDHSLAYDALTAHPNFDPAYKLLSGHKLKIPEWRDPALRALLSIGTDKLSAQQKEWLHGFEVDGQAFYLTLAELRAWLFRNRLEITETYAQCQKHVTCRSHALCESTWSRIWTGFVRHWLHSSSGCSEERAREILRAADIDGLGPCLHGMRDSLTEKALLQEEEKIQLLLHMLESASHSS
ncbi:hypothetical protein EXIGLDRAFT_766225 [Exidia glandulosa HHB12029]|uniref:BTB domain-containing protein n=1 Tax=Exidia glandulosa HHB12029 TaxID=1314781 RepID=A0A165JW44_EXIGL|nr:hypothetical protein EXIGLDRAFT_766225 [Exidia glandulosa HHB12029]